GTGLRAGCPIPAYARRSATDPVCHGGPRWCTKTRRCPEIRTAPFDRGLAARRGTGSSAGGPKLLKAPALVDSRSAAAQGMVTDAEMRSLRVVVSPYLFRSMLVGMGAVAVGLHRATGNRRLAWDFAKARARTLERMLGVRVTVTGLENVSGAGPVVYTPNH